MDLFNLESFERTSPMFTTELIRFYRFLNTKVGYCSIGIHRPSANCAYYGKYIWVKENLVNRGMETSFCGITKEEFFESLTNEEKLVFCFNLDYIDELIILEDVARYRIAKRIFPV